MPKYLKCQIVISFLQENLKTQSLPFSQANGKSFRFFLVFRIAVPLGVQHHKRKKSSERLSSKLFHWKNGQAPYYVTNEPHSLQEIPELAVHWMARMTSRWFQGSWNQRSINMIPRQTVNIPEQPSCNPIFAGNMDRLHSRLDKP